MLGRGDYKPVRLGDLDVESTEAVRCERDRIRETLQECSRSARFGGATTTWPGCQLSPASPSITPPALSRRTINSLIHRPSLPCSPLGVPARGRPVQARRARKLLDQHAGRVPLTRLRRLACAHAVIKCLRGFLALCPLELALSRPRMGTAFSIRAAAARAPNTVPCGVPIRHRCAIAPGCPYEDLRLRNVQLSSPRLTLSRLRAIATYLARVPCHRATFTEHPSSVSTSSRTDCA
ncbi:hypothetical protein C8Q77DRAFT_250699 [Trametes polyzona]|nr:hypothetical protein C8Q77DRAFT_250699 [Trametes polyzona]